MTLPLVDALPPALPDTREAREEQLAKLPPAPVHSLLPPGKLGREAKRARARQVEGEPGVARATVDPIGHLETCPGCRDDDALIAQGFRRCSTCSRWCHEKCQYDGRCTTCHIAAGGECDNRDLSYEWSFPGTALPAGSIKAALAGERLPWE